MFIVSACTFSYLMRKNICTLYTCNTLSKCRLTSATHSTCITDSTSSLLFPPEKLRSNERNKKISFTTFISTPQGKLKSAQYNLFKKIFITASACRSRCLRFSLCKVLVVSLIIDFLRKSAGGNSLTFLLGIL